MSFQMTAGSLSEGAAAAAAISSEKKKSLADIIDISSTSRDGCIKFLTPPSWEGSLTSLLGKNIKLCIGVQGISWLPNNIKTVMKNFNWGKGEGEKNLREKIKIGKMLAGKNIKL